MYSLDQCSYLLDITVWTEVYNTTCKMVFGTDNSMIHVCLHGAIIVYNRVGEV